MFVCERETVYTGGKAVCVCVCFKRVEHQRGMSGVEVTSR